MTEKKSRPEVIDVKAVLAGDDAFIRSPSPALQEVLEAEMTEAVGAGEGERTVNRVGYRSGYYGRTLITRVGKLELRVPQGRDGRFSTELFERYQRSEKALVAALADVRARRFHPEGQSDHRGVVRACVLGVIDQRDQQATGREPGAVRASAAGRDVSLSDP